MAAKSTVEHAEKCLASKRWSVRKRGMALLAELGEHDRILKYALREKVPAVIDIAADALYPEPVELLLHMVSVVKGPDANLCLRYHVPFGNYLYAADALAYAYHRRRMHLHPDVIAAAGLAELATFTPFLEKYLSALLENIKSARDRGVLRSTDGVCVSVNSDGSDTWTRAASCAIEAAVALRRIGIEFSPVNVNRMVFELPEAMHDCYQRRLTHAKLLWVLFDLGDDSLRSSVLNAVDDGMRDVVADVLTTLLRRRQFRDAEQLARRADVIYAHRGEFHFWPLCDFLDSRQLLKSHFLHDDKYRRARNHRIGPPHWWSWITPDRVPK